MILFEHFSNREISIFIWSLVIVLFLLFSKKLRTSLFRTLTIFFGKTILKLIAMALCYYVAQIYLLHYIGIWDFSLIKDTIVWFIVVGLVLLFSTTKARDTGFFRQILIDSVKWSLFLEFIINFHSFSLLVEIFIIPIITLLFLTQAFAETKQEYEPTNKLLTYILAIIGLSLIAYSVYKTILIYAEFLTWDNLLSFILAPILTILFIPFLYFFTLYMNYSDFFIHLNFLTNDKSKKNKVKRNVLLTARINMNKLYLIRRNIRKHDLLQTDDIKAYVKSLITTELGQWPTGRHHSDKNDNFTN